MKIQEAINIVGQASALAQLSKQGHIQVEQSLKTIQDYVDRSELDKKTVNDYVDEYVKGTTETEKKGK